MVELARELRDSTHGAILVASTIVTVASGSRRSRPHFITRSSTHRPYKTWVKLTGSSELATTVTPIRMGFYTSTPSWNIIPFPECPPRLCRVGCHGICGVYGYSYVSGRQARVSMERARAATHGRGWRSGTAMTAVHIRRVSRAGLGSLVQLGLQWSFGIHANGPSGGSRTWCSGGLGRLRGLRKTALRA